LINNYFILKAQTNYLNNIVQGFFIDSIYTFKKDKVVITLKKNNSSVSLLISFERNFESLYLDESFYSPKNNLYYFFDSLTGSSIKKISTLDNNRCLRIDLGMQSLFISFIPNKTNLFMVQDNLIVDSFNSKENFLNKDISLLFPTIKNTNKEYEEGNLDSYITIKYKILGKFYLNELLKQIKEKNITFQSVDKFVEDFENEIIKSEELCIYENNGKFIPSLIKIDDLQPVEVFNDINSLITFYLRNVSNIISSNNIKINLKQRLIDKKNKTETKIENLQTELSKAQNFNTYKEFGDILLTNKINIKNDSIEYACTVDNKNLLIKLDKDLSVVENANKYYNKYKGLKKSLSILNEKINSLRIDLDKINNELSSFNDNMNYKELKKIMKTTKLQKEKEELPFRIFKLDDNYEVWVGKSSASNDLLTTKYTNQYELWFHVRGSSGSHTVLKFTDKNLKPTKETISIAASIAAYYSKAKNAKNVPVAYTEKRNVKKKKGFKEGSVVMEKEKVIFVNPKLPD